MSSCIPAPWRSATWALRSSLARLADLDALADLAPLQDIVDRVAELAADYTAPADVVELWTCLRFAIAERRKVQSRATRVLLGYDK